MPKRKNDNLSPLYFYEKGMDWNPVEKVIMERRSIRSFKDKPIPDSLIRRVLEAGRFSPSAGNAQPWKFIVVTDPEIIAKMEKTTIKLTKLIMWFVDYERNFIRKIFLKPLVKIIARFRPNELHPIPFNLMQRIAAEKVPVYHNPTAIILLLVDKRGVGRPPLDMGIAGQNMVLAAHSLGLGTCWIGMITVLMKLPQWRKFFNVKYPYSLDDCLILGWPQADFDGETDREVQVVDWYRQGSKGKPEVEQQGGD